MFRVIIAYGRDFKDCDLLKPEHIPQTLHIHKTKNPKESGKNIDLFR